MSPWVRRMLEAQEATQHRADQFATADLGDRVRADARFIPSERELADIEADLREAQTDQEAPRG